MLSAWRQGSVFKATDVPAALKMSVDQLPRPAVDPAADRLMILTQDCDLLHDRMEDEPWAELIPLRPLGSFNKNRDNPCLHGKNPRRLVFQVEVGPLGAWWRIDPHSRFRIPREALFGLAPDEEKGIPVPSAQSLARWIARRYTRAALADGFNSRLNRKANELGELWKRSDAEAVSGVYLSGAREDLPEDQDYQLEVILSVEADSMRNPARLESAQRVSQRLDEILSSCPGLVVTRLSERLEQDLTLRDLRTFQRLDLDFRSGTDRPGASGPVGEAG